jgi:hypothetical protein
MEKELKQKKVWKSHLHVFLESHKKVEIANKNKLDLFWSDKTYHGNYQGARSKENTLCYMLKDITNKKGYREHFML